MPPISSDKAIQNEFNKLTKRISNLELNDQTKQQFIEEIQNLISEETKRYEETLDALDEQIRFNYSSAKTNIPPALLKLTIDEIREAGGDVCLDPETNTIVYRIPNSLVSPEFKLPSSGIRPPSAKKDTQGILKEVLAHINKVQASATRNNKRPRMTAMTPSHTMTTRKKIQRVTKYSPSGFDDSMIYSNTRALRSVAKPVASRVNSISTVRKGPVSSKVPAKAIPKTTSKVESKGSSTDVSIENHQQSSTSSTESIRLTLVNPKTPGGQHRLFNKQPRAVKEGEIIVHCSTAGTPLLIKQQAGK